MKRRTVTLFASLIAISALTVAKAASPRLEPVFSSPLIANGAATLGSRLFLPVQPTEPGAGPEVVEVKDGKPIPYPNAAWNGWQPGSDGGDRFVGVNALRVGPDGALWVVDRGSPGIGKPLVPHGVKLVRIDTGSDHVTRVYDLAELTTARSFVDDVRFNGRLAYLTDAGQPGLIVLDLDNGKGRRVLDGDSSTIAHKPLIAEGKPLVDSQGKPVVVNADQLEVSPDGAWFYYQPASGGMSRIATRWLDDPALPAAELARHVEPFADTPSTGGTAIDATGTIYLSDVDHKRIMTISPGGKIETLLADPRLIWVDAMWIDDAGNLLLPAAQLNRTSGLNGGKDALVQPITLYRLPIGAKPLRN